MKKDMHDNNNEPLKFVDICTAECCSTKNGICSGGWATTIVFPEDNITTERLEVVLSGIEYQTSPNKLALLSIEKGIEKAVENNHIYINIFTSSDYVIDLFKNWMAAINKYGWTRDMLLNTSNKLNKAIYSLVLNEGYFLYIELVNPKLGDILLQTELSAKKELSIIERLDRY